MRKSVSPSLLILSRKQPKDNKCEDDGHRAEYYKAKLQKGSRRQNNPTSNIQLQQRIAATNNVQPKISDSYHEHTSAVQLEGKIHDILHT